MNIQKNSANKWINKNAEAALGGAMEDNVILLDI